MTCSTSYKVRVKFSRIDLRSGYHQLRECMKKIFQRLPLGRGMDILSCGYAFWINQCTSGFHGLDELVGVRAAEGKVVCQVFQEWAKEQEEAFQTLKGNLRNALILSLPDGSKEFVVYCDASNQGLSCVLMQRGKVENAAAEMLCGLDQLMERKEGGGMYLLWVPLISDVRTLMMDEAHASRYLVYSGADKTYYDLRDMYGGHVWRRILLSMLPRSSSGYDTNWVIVDSLTKKALRTRLKHAQDLSSQMDGQSERTIQTSKDMLRAVEVGDKVMLEVPSWKDVVHFGKKEILAPRYVFDEFPRRRAMLMKLDVHFLLRVVILLFVPLYGQAKFYPDNSCISEGARRYGDFATGVGPETKSMRNSTCHCGGNPDKSSGNTSTKSGTTGISLNLGSSTFAFIRALATPEYVPLKPKVSQHLPMVSQPPSRGTVSQPYSWTTSPSPQSHRSFHDLMVSNL
ncbi:putative reverse transcriptase domain-containing protein [Tanacetum coccineum]